MTSLERRTAILAIILVCSTAVANPALGQGLFGPGKFKIEQGDDRFSTSATTMVIGQNNRVTKKSPAGGFYISAQGLYLNPIAVRSRNGGKLVQTGFVIENRTEIDTTFGSPNTLGSLVRVSFLINGSQLIPLAVTAADERFSDRIAYNTISRSASSAVNESGMIYLKPSDMAALASAATVAIQVEGTERTWTIEAKDVSKSFLENVGTFYSAEVASGT